MTSDLGEIMELASALKTVAEIGTEHARLSGRLYDQLHAEMAEIRDAIVEQDGKTSRRLDALHTRIDEMGGAGFMPGDIRMLASGEVVRWDGGAFRTTDLRASRIDEMEGKR